MAEKSGIIGGYGEATLFQRLVLPVIDSIKAAVFPHQCLVCNSFIDISGATPGHAMLFSGNRSAYDVFETCMQGVLCPSCITKYDPFEVPYCSVCGMVFKSRVCDNHTCQKCIDSPPRFNTARAVGIYSGSLLTLIHRIKYGGKIQLARPLGRLLFYAFQSFFTSDQFDMILPVPLHIRRFRQRGFNQAYVLIREWEMLSSTLHSPPLWHIEKEMILRQKPTLPQTGLGKAQRIENLKGAFVVPVKHAVDGKRILIIDDVFTTGATVNACAKVLRQAGAKHVDVLTLARAIMQ